MNYLEKKQIVMDVVQSYFNRNAEACSLNNLSDDATFHIIDLGVSMLMTKWKLDSNAGSFVQAFVANDLMQALGRADSTSMKGFKFFGRLIYNVDFPMSLYLELEKNN